MPLTVYLRVLPHLHPGPHLQPAPQEQSLQGQPPEEGGGATGFGASCFAASFLPHPNMLRTRVRLVCRRSSDARVMTSQLQLAASVLPVCCGLANTDSARARHDSGAAAALATATICKCCDKMHGVLQ